VATRGRAAVAGRSGRARKAATTLAGKGGRAARRVVSTVRAAGKAVKATVRAVREPRPPAEPIAPPVPQLAGALSEEERIESAKYLPAAVRPRLFEEERFVFPSTYGVNRVRLLVKDPEWLFAHWDVSTRTLADVRSELGDRAAALSRLTLRVTDTMAGSVQVILLPDDARAWYVRADVGPRSYRAEVGLTLPSGHFRSLAQSNTVITPAGAPAGEVSTRTARYRRTGPVTPVPAGAAPSGVKAAAARTPPAGARRATAGPKDLHVEAQGGASDRFGGAAGDRTDKGGASDRFRR
jgi:hypothetical protein